MSCLVCGNCFTSWSPSDDLKQHYPPRHSDYRDSLPLDLKTVYELYKPYVKDGAWTFGLFEMWFWKAKPVKHSVHIPCWDSFKWFPWLWRGICFGRTPMQCYWTGLRQMRWSRGAYSAALGREYVMPVKDISRHEKGFASDIKALCVMYFAMGTVFGMGIGQIFTLCGNFMFNFAACYSCHSREKIRRKYKLPPTFGLPPGIDDCVVHFICSYCASHQELRELAVRGVDGPGMHIMDVLPHAYDHLPGHEEVVKARQEVVAAMLANPPKLFKPRVKAAVEYGSASDAAKAKAAAEKLAAVGAAPVAGLEVNNEKDDATLAAAEVVEASGASEAISEAEPLGWAQYIPPPSQEMGRVVTATPVASGGDRAVKRAYSVAY